jgi:hypothetical protein
MAPTAVAIEPPPWPSDRRDLLFLWQTANEPNLAFNPRLRELVAYPLEARGRARLDRTGAMLLAGGGGFEAPAEAAGHLGAGARASRALTVEATLTPAASETSAFVPIAALSAGPRERSFALGQEGRFLVLSLLTGPEETPVASPVRLWELAAGRADHAVFTYARGRLAAYRDGAEVAVAQTLAGGFARWRPGRLRFGSEGEGGPAWAGKLEGVALYARELGAAEVRENHRRYAMLRALRPAAPARLEVRARLVACSRVPTLREISPYRQALIACDWEVEEVLPGSSAGGRLRVAHWALLDGERQPIARLAPGAERRLVLEPYEAHPELTGDVLSDSLPPGAPGRLHVDLGL